MFLTNLVKMQDLPISLGEKLGFLKQPKGFATRAIHSGQESDQWSSGFESI